ncbi:NADP-dependent malic enzyme [Candidatus Collierbacteria bacterium]|nr:NADP-dependent malic enzyme [Candidatus Collierbacteria bacterium]
MDYKIASLQKHKATKGKIEISSKFGKLTTKDDLSIAYTPGVAAVSELLAKEPKKAYDYSIKANTIAIVSDGSAVLGLGNIGPLGALPVMEGKAILFKQFGAVDAYPLVLATQNTEEIINVVKAIAPTFGGINLEDISAPRCFEIEDRLRRELTIPVFHDDQHGTAIVVLAALINSLKITGKKKENLEVVFSGAGAAGIAVAKLLLKYGVGNIVMTDSKGIISLDRPDLTREKLEIAKIGNINKKNGGLGDALKGADVYIGVSAAGIASKEMITAMNQKAVVLALANPVPEIMPEEAKKGGAYIIGTGRSDYPNQINNVLAFPGVFRGALDHRVKQITNEMKLKAAQALADCVNKKELSPEKIIPSPFDLNVVKRVAATIKD